MTLDTKNPKAYQSPSDESGSWRFAWTAIGILFALSIGAYFMPPVGGPRSASPRALSMRNMRQIASAIHIYESEHGHMPPPFTVDEAGNPLHSWRVLLLPYLDQGNLYKAIDLTKPWNHPDNVKVHQQVPPCYQDPKYDSPSRAQTTMHVGIVGIETAWNPNDPVKPAELEDGTSNTLLLVQSEQYRVLWMAPFDP